MKPTTQKNRLWRALALQSGLLFTAGSLALAPTVSFAETTSTIQSYQIPAGKLSTALADFAKTSGLLLSVDGALLEGQTTQGLNGQFSVKQGLAKLLQGSQLKAHFDGEKRVTINSKDYSGDNVLNTIEVTTDSKLNRSFESRDLSLNEIERFQAKDEAEVFKNDSSIQIGGGSPAAERLYLRGIEGSNLNVTLDGASQGMNLFQHRGNIGTLDPDLLKQVEVQTLPSADQGPGALAGSIRFETVDAQDMLDPGEHIGASLKAGYNSVDEGWKKGGSAYGQFGEHAGLLVHYSDYDYSEYKDGNGDKINGSNGEKKDLFAKFSLLDLEDNSLRVSAENYIDEGLYTGDWDYTSSKAAVPTHQKTERTTYIVDHRYTPENNPWVDWKINAYWSENSLKRETSKMQSNGLGVNLRNIARFDIGQTNHALTVGADYTEEDGHVWDDGHETGTHVDVKTQGLYLQDRMQAGPVLVSFGARFDDFDTRYGNTRLTDTAISPNVGLDAEFGYGLSGFASYGEANRMTGIIPIGWLADTVDNATINQEPGKDRYGKSLKPEKSETTEYGLRFEQTNLMTANDRFKTQVSLFDTRIENLIAQIGGQRGLPVTGFYNEDPITTKGYEIRVDWWTDPFDTHLSFTHANTEQNGKAVAFTRRMAASMGDTIAWDNLWRVTSDISLGYTLKYVADLKRDDIDRSGYTLHNAQLQWQPHQLKGLEIALAVNNIFNEQYSSQASSGDDDSATPEPGRDIRIEASYRF